jgi:hypothetical protein
VTTNAALRAGRLAGLALTAACLALTSCGASSDHALRAGPTASASGSPSPASPSPSPSVPATTAAVAPPTTPAAAATLPAVCRFATAAEIGAILDADIGYVTDVAGGCAYYIGDFVDGESVNISFFPGAKRFTDNTSKDTPVKDLGATAYWDNAFTLEVLAKHGLVWIYMATGTGSRDPVALARQIYQLIAPRLH